MGHLSVKPTIRLLALTSFVDVRVGDSILFET